MEMGEFNSDDHYIYYCGQESLRRSAVAHVVNKIEHSLKNDRMILVHFQDKPFNITVFQVYAPTTDAEEAEVDLFYKDLQDLLELTPKKCPFCHMGLECKSRKLRDTWSNRQIWLWRTSVSSGRIMRLWASVSNGWKTKGTWVSCHSSSWRSKGTDQEAGKDEGIWHPPWLRYAQCIYITKTDSLTQNLNI